MNEPKHENILIYRKTENGKELLCRIQLFDDGSALVDTDDGATIFEGSPSACREAISHVELLGYVRVDSSQSKAI